MVRYKTVGASRISLTLIDSVIIFIIALAIRVIWSLLAPQIDPFLKINPLLGDAASYDLIVRNLINGFGYSVSPKGPTSFWPPLYPFSLYIIYSITGYNLVVARLIQGILGAFVPVFVFLSLQKPCGRYIALLTSLGLAFYPYIIYFSAWLIAEGLYIFLLASVFWSASNMVEKWSRISVIELGVLLGLCVLAKPTTLFFIPFIALWLFTAPMKKNIWQRVSNLLLLGVCTFCVLLPWTIRNFAIYHQFVLVSTNGGYTFLGANNPNAWGGHEEGFPPAISGLNEAQMENEYYAQAFRWIKSDPAGFIHLLGPKYRRLLSPLSVASSREEYPILGAPIIYIVYTSFLFLALVGMVLARKSWRQIGFFYAPVFGVVLSTGLYYGDVRYTLPMVPSLVFFTAIVLESGWQKFIFTIRTQNRWS